MHKLVFSRRGALLGMLGCLAAVGLAIPATAAARVTSLTSCQAITAPGKYRLDGDVSTGARTCFDITASGVRLNLNGHTITGVAGFGIFAESGASNANVVGPGTVTGWSQGINLHGGNGSVRGVTATDNRAGILTTSGGNSIRGNKFTSNLFDGIFITFVGGGNSIRGNDVTGNGFGISVGSPGNTIIGNFAHNNGIDLFDVNPNCGSNVWRGNDFGTANQSCIH